MKYGLAFWLEYWAAMLHDYGAIIFGLAIGAIAHVGRKLTEGEQITAMQLIGYMMQLGVIGLIASVSTRELEITDSDMRALVTAVLAISAQEVMQAIKRKGWRAILTATEPSDPRK